MTKKVLVTGANGYIGRHIVNRLIELGATVLAADINLSEVNPKAVKVTIPIFSESETLFEDLGSPDILLHMAWRNGFNHNAESHIDDLTAHYHFIKRMIDGGLKQVAVMGSMHEIGYWEGEIDENTPARPASLYGIAKNALRETTFLTAKDKAIVQWLRGYYIVGDDERSNSIFGKIIQAEKDGKTEFPFTSGKNKYDFIDIDELADQISKTILQNKVTGIINVATGTPMSLADRVEKFIEDHHFKIKLKYGAFPDRPYDSPGVWANADKVNSILKDK